jgi:sugar transferase (PEP-CTERM/EpsH1 system associated)
MRVLFLAHRVPWPPDKGDRLRSDAILRWLSARHEVYLGAVADTGDPREAETAESQLRPLCAGIRIVPRPPTWRGLRAFATGRSISEEVFWTPALEQFVRTTVSRVHIDVAFAYSSQMARLLFDLPNIRRVVDLVDVDSEKWRRRFALSRNPIYWLEARRVRALEQACLRHFDGVTVVSSREAKILGGESDRLRVVRMGVDLASFTPRASDPGGVRLGFVGAMDYPPNADGVVWLAREVLPRIRAKCPGAVLVIVGRRAPEALRTVPGVEITGWVEDVRPVLQSCAVAVVPIHISHGVQTKAVVTMALGVPQVMTHAALEGLEAEDGRDALAASDPAQFADRVVALLESPEERARIAGHGRRFAETHFDWDRNLLVLGELLFPGPRSSNNK